jgi:hypothetical protein
MKKNTKKGLFQEFSDIDLIQKVSVIRNMKNSSLTKVFPQIQI